MLGSKLELVGSKGTEGRMLKSVTLSEVCSLCQVQRRQRILWRPKGLLTIWGSSLLLKHVDWYFVVWDFYLTPGFRCGGFELILPKWQKEERSGPLARRWLRRGGSSFQAGPAALFARGSRRERFQLDAGPHDDALLGLLRGRGCRFSIADSGLWVRVRWSHGSHLTGPWGGSLGRDGVAEGRGSGW